MKRINKKILKLIVIDIILLAISVFTYVYIFKVETTKKLYALKSEEFIEATKNPVFKIDKIIMYNSAYAVDNSEGDLSDINISHFTDISIYIDNKSKIKEITPENTVNEMYITGIKIDSNKQNNGEKSFNYKNPLSIGKFIDIENWKDDGILFNVIKTNEKNKTANYDENVFYTDCSNPISLGYVNKNILTNGVVSNVNGTITFDGSILKLANIDLKELDTAISFSINLTNNYNEKFVCNVILDNKIATEDEEIYSGYYMKVFKPKDIQYNFIKVSN